MAIYQEIPNVKNVRVDERSIRFSIENWRYRYTTPKRAVTAINTFDAGKHPKPFQLQLTKANITDTTNVNKYMRDYIRQIPKNSGGNSPPKPVKKIVRQFGLCTKV
jgi:hypothetical protein